MSEKILKGSLTPSTNDLMGNDKESIKNSFVNHLEYSLAKDEYTVTPHDGYASMALLVRDRLIEKWINTQQSYYNKEAKRVYYLSLEFLIGRTLGNSLINLGLYGKAADAMKELGYDLEELREQEWDAGLGNGGLGRLAACFMDSLATLEIPSIGYGIRYDYGIFFQKIIDGYQVESPDNWLRLGNFWEFPRPGHLYPVEFYGNVEEYTDSSGSSRQRWINTETVMAMAYDTPVPGYRNGTVNNLRLWSAKSSREFNLDYFNSGDYEKAVSDKSVTENITRVLYPNDNVFEGKELRLKQEYFFVSATIQDIIRRHKKAYPTLDNFHEKAAVQLNDTHPAIAIPELMRRLVDIENMDWDKAWNITVRAFGYTNHTVLPEALERWPVCLIEKVLPRHLQIIYRINDIFLKEMYSKYPGEHQMIRNLSVIEEGENKKVRMANLAIIGSHSINGVAALHTRIIRETIFPEFNKVYPEKFNNKTNGITQRRWLKLCNPRLAELITEAIGEKWTTDLSELKKLRDIADDSGFQTEWMKVKQANKDTVSEYINSRNGIKVDPQSMFDVQVKRIHEYKRQLLNLLHAATFYNRIKDNPGGAFVPRTIIFAGKAAPGYYIAKLIIKLINSVAETVNSDPAAENLLKIIFLRNYAVSNAEKIIPGADLSEQISTAGMEASGTGNMKLSLNGALTIGTMDGANVEMSEEVGKENFFIFGMNADEVSALKQSGYDPYSYYSRIPELKRVIDQIWNGEYSRDNPDIFRPVMESLLYHGDQYCLFADYESYINCQNEVSDTWQDTRRWARLSILNAAGMGKFSSDRTISEYARDIWKVSPVKIPHSD